MPRIARSRTRQQLLCPRVIVHTGCATGRVRSEERGGQDQKKGNTSTGGEPRPDRGLHLQHSDGPALSGPNSARRKKSLHADRILAILG